MLGVSRIVTRAAVRDLAIPTPDDLRRPGFGILVNEPPRF